MRGATLTEASPMTPYRLKTARLNGLGAPLDRFDRLAAPLLMVAVGLLRCSIAVAGGETWGVEASTALIMVALGARLAF
jgi:hypothetical protein